MPVYHDKKTNRLYIEFQYKGTRHKERLPEGMSKKDGERIEVKLKGELMFSSHGVETRSAVMTFDRFVDEYFGPVADSWPADRYDRLVQLVKAFRPFIRDKAMRDIKAIHIKLFKDSRIALPTQHSTPRKPATVEREMSIISSIFRLAVDNDIIEYNPCSRVKALRFDNTVDKVLRREDEAAFFANMHSQWARDICRFVLNTGMSQRDVMTLTRFQIDRTDRVVRFTRSKTRNKVVITLNDVALEILDRRMPDARELIFASPVTGTENGSVRHAMQRACTRAEIPVITIRDLRRTFGVRLIEQGTSASTAADALGHSDNRSIHRYTRSLEAKRKATDSLIATENKKLKVVKISS
jgi:integrase